MLKFTVTRSGEVSKKTWNEAMKATYYAGAEHWHDRFLARHFTVQGARLYGYARRSRKYAAAKRSQKGHSDPLVWSGDSRDQAKDKKIRSTRTGGKAVVNAPTLNRAPRKGRRFKMSEEVTRRTENETRSIIAVMRKRLEAALKDAAKRKNKE